MNEKFKERFREITPNREVRAELAKQLGCTPAAINQYRSGKILPSVKNLIRIADLYNVSIDWILGRSDIVAPLTQEHILEANKLLRQLADVTSIYQTRK